MCADQSARVATTPATDCCVQLAMSFVDNRQFWTEFIQLYQVMRPLWDTASRDYRNKRVRDECYLTMVAKTRDIFPNASVEFVKRKIENLRTCFRRELRKVEKSKGGGEVYQPQLWYFELMLFTTASDGSEVYPVKREAGETDEDDPGHFEDCQDIYEAELLIEPSNSPVAAAVTEPTARTPSPSATSRPAKKRPRHDFQIDSDLFSPTVTLTSFNEPYVFGKSVGLQLNEVDQRQKVIAEKVISEVLFHAKLGHLTESSTVLLSQASSNCSTPTTSTQPTCT